SIGTVAANQTVECDGSGNTAAYAAFLSSHGGASATDGCGGAVTWSDDSGTALFVNDCGSSKHILITFTAKDASNNTNSTSATFNYTALFRSSIGTVAANQTVECDGSGNTAAYAAFLSSHGGASATDGCGGAVTWSDDSGTALF